MTRPTKAEHLFNGSRPVQRTLIIIALTALSYVSMRGYYWCSTEDKSTSKEDGLQSETNLQIGKSTTGKCYLSPSGRLTSPVDHGIEPVTPGRDSFPMEKYAEKLSARLQELRSWLKASPIMTTEISTLLAPGFRSSRLLPKSEVTSSTGELQVFRAVFAPALELDREAFPSEFAAFRRDFQAILVAELEIVAIEVEGGDTSIVRTTVDYDLVGKGTNVGQLQKNGQWKIDWKKESDGKWKAVSWLSLYQTRSQVPEPVFVDASNSALGRNASFVQQLQPGVGEWQSVLDEALGMDVFGNNGVAAGDIDGDGLDDFYVCQPSGLPNRLYRNLGDGTFMDITEAAGVGVLDPSSMALFSDVDNDGDQDLVVITWKQPLLFLNDGHGKFALKADAFHFEQAPRGTLTAASMADFDRDGYLDLYVCAYSYWLGEASYQLPMPYHDANNGPPNALFHNDGKGNFTEVTKITGMDQNNRRFSFACAWADYNQDGWPDLYVVNDFGRNNLYRNNGRAGNRVTFTDVAAEAGVEDIGAGMSVAWLDYDNDELLDLYVGNMWSAAGQRISREATFQTTAAADTIELYRRHAKGNSLFRNLGNGTFEEVSSTARAEKGRWAWSCDSLDFDSDGWEDLYIANGNVTNSSLQDLSSFFWRQVVGQSPLTATPRRQYEEGWRGINKLIREDVSFSGHERNIFLRNDGKGGFDDVSGTVDLDIDQDGRAFAIADYDLDGDPDILLKGRTGPQVRLLRNDFKTTNASVSFRLVGSKSNRDAIGARVTVQTDSSRQAKILQAGSAFLCQHSKELLFGLGRANGIRQVTIQWPSGLRQILNGVPLNHRIRVEEGNDRFLVQPFRPRNFNAPLSRQAPRTLPPLSYTGTWLLDPYLVPNFRLKDVEGKEHELANYRQRPVVLHFWDHRCLSCLEGLKAFRENLASLDAADVRLLTVAVNANDELEAVKQFVREQGLNFTVLIGDKATIESYNILNRFFFGKRQDLLLPATMLLDGSGRVGKLYQGPASITQILTDLAQLSASAEERLKRALPFAGNYYMPPPGRDYFQFGIAFAESGFIDAALAALQETILSSPGSAEAYYNLGTLYMRKGDAKAAQSAFRQALEIRLNYPEVHNNLGMLLAEAGQLKEAITHFEKALALRPDYPIALNNLGHAYMQSGNIQTALRLLEKAVELQPQYPEALNNLGILHGNRGDLKEAKSYFEKALTARPNYPQAIVNLAMIDAVIGLIDEAIRLLRDSLERSPAFELTYLTLGQIYLQAGKKSEGVRVLQDLLRTNPNHAEAQRILQQLKAGTP